MKSGKKSGKKKRRKTRPAGIIRALPPDHPQSLDNPANRKAWLELMRELGRVMADHEWDRMMRERKRPKDEDD